MAKYFKGRIILPSEIDYNSQEIRLGYLGINYGKTWFEFYDSEFYPQGTKKYVLDYP